MPKPGAFDKAKVKGSGGFGASKSGRFDGPKESCDYTPSASAYNAYVSIGEQLTKSAKKQAFVNGLKTNGGGKVAGFGSGSKRGSAIVGSAIVLSTCAPPTCASPTCHCWKRIQCT